MLIRLLLAFTVIPLVELYLLLQLGHATSPMATFLVVILTGVIGSYLARREGAAAWQRFQGALGEKRMPSREIQDGLMVVFAAALLLTPGLITDAFGFVMLVPIGRDFIRKHFLSRFFRGVQVQVTSGTSQVFQGSPLNRNYPNDSKTIDAQAVRRDVS
ncbi:phage T7 F exclusion suppressor FxsA [Rubripirellula obstinata]|uniref:Phage T7 F exclusion suppressor FxsA n=1 Tax=Rubripirellula obstinata TaxID=406547 RepID=A0A5B1CJ82_9BACT|nr:FxsA family protein [Rubripirellula obstinata]KAA1259513.1 phage T7 F exclusion suppressor FxsA [Rubripirellula obstinata]